MTVSPLSLAMLGELQEWAEYQPLARAQREVARFAGLYDEAMRKSVISEARKEMLARRKVREGREEDDAKRERFSHQLSSTINSLDGTAKLLWLMVRKSHPEITEDWIREAIELIGLESVQQAMDDVSAKQPDPLDAIAEKKTTGWKRIGATCSAIWRRLTGTHQSR